MKALYLECGSGISGDMTVAALLDLGADRELLEKTLETVPADGFTTRISRVKKAGIDCCDFDVVLADGDTHDHDMEYLHGHEKGEQDHRHGHDDEHHHGHHHHHDHDHEHEDSHEHGHHHDHDHEHHHHHEHRGMKEIREILGGTEMPEEARLTAVRIFEVLAAAEAKAHAVPEEEVHFHEVGALDSIVDIISMAVCLEDLKRRNNITDVIVKSVTEGTGTVRCQHGILPVPVPAVMNIAEDHGLTLRIANVPGELVTPTGAAFLAAVTTRRELPEGFRVIRTGLGAGKREYSLPGILRAMIIETDDKITYDIESTGTNDTDVIYRLETDIDDSTGEELGLVMELLFAAGAREVHYSPVYMKKNRPAWELVVICSEQDISRMEDIIFRNTTTIGIRRIRMERTVLPRSTVTVRVGGHSVRVKVCGTDGDLRYYPEYDDVAAAVRDTGRPYREIADEASKLGMRGCGGEG